MRFLLSLHVSVPWRTPSMGAKTVSAVDHWISGWMAPEKSDFLPDINSQFALWVGKQLDGALSHIGAPPLELLRCLFDPTGPLSDTPYLRLHLDLSQYGYLNPTPNGYAAAHAIAQSLGTRLMHAPQLAPWKGAFMYRTPSYCGASVIAASEYLNSCIESELLSEAILQNSPYEVPKNWYRELEQGLNDDHSLTTTGRL